MYIRKAKVRGEVYYSVVEGFRDEFGRVKQRTLVSLGKSSSVSEAVEATRARIEADSELFVRVVREFVRILTEGDFDVPTTLSRIAIKQRSSDADRLKVLATMKDEAGLTHSETEDDVDGTMPDVELPWPSWALRKLTQLDRRICEEQQRLEKLSEIAPQFTESQLPAPRKVKGQ